MRCWIPFLLIGLVAAPVVRGGEIDFVEDFALAQDRSAALKQLIPGTDDYYYYHALHYLNTQQFAKVRELMGPWLERHNRTPRFIQIETRLALLAYANDPKATLDFLRQRLNLNLNHQREVLDAEPNFATAINSDELTRDAYYKRLSQIVKNLDGAEDSALDWLVLQPLDPDRTRNLLQRLSRPDYAGLPKKIVDDLNHPNSPGFGAFGIHQLLLLDQLEELVKLKPDLLNQQAFVNNYLVRLQPGPDDDWRNQPALREAYLTRLQTFANRLAPVHNSLKAHVLYHRLQADRARRVYDKARLLEYLKLPRPMGYVRREYLERQDLRAVHANLAADYSPQTLLPPIHNDEPLVRSLLAQVFVDATDPKEFEPYVNDAYLKQLFAETKIVNGLGDAEQWASQLSPEQFRQLRERVDLDFAFENKVEFGANDPVKLDLHVKNVNTLIVKVFEINAETYYRGQQREIDTDINLDGLVANSEATQKYDDSPLRRVKRTFDFPQLAKPGVYVVDFIGNGRSSRALIRKGRLRHVVRTTPVGQRFTVLDEQNKKLEGARIWLDGHEYQAEKDGTILVPFTRNAQRRSIVLSHGNVASLDAFQHEAELYALNAGFYVDRESLLTRKKANLVVRLGVTLNGIAISTKVLKDVELEITSRDHDGIVTTQRVPNLPVFEDRETVHEFQVPARLASIEFIVRGKVKNASLGEDTPIGAVDSFALNEIDRTEKIEDLHLLRHAEGYVIEVTGRTGEPKASRPVHLAIKHRDFAQPFETTLKTNPQGQITLGQLHEIAMVTATGPEGTAHSWVIRGDQHTWPGTLHGRAGETLSLPYFGAAKQPERSELSLLELRGDSFAADRFEKLSIKDGLLQIAGLAAGDYDLWIKTAPARIRIRVVEGPQEGTYVLGATRQLETIPLARPQIESIKPVDKDKLSIQLRNVSPVTRVHVFVDRIYPAYSAFDRLSRVRGPEPYLFVPGRASSAYVTGRNIGDEYRYILDRKYAPKYPGNTLERPSLLLNPWAVRSTETGRIVAAGGDAFAPKSESAAGAAEQGAKPGQAGGAGGDFANLDFLANASVVAANLLPNEKGVIEIPLAALDGRQQVHVVAVDPLHTTYRSHALPLGKPLFVDLRQVASLDPKGHFGQQKRITVVPSGQVFTMPDVTTGRLETYDSLARVYALYMTFSTDEHLAEFNFILKWPQLKPEEKREKYSKFASHELNLFLAKKDPEFFRAVVRPYLANKKHKTFLDRYLLEEPIDEYLLPWKHAQLNIPERILLGQRVAEQRSHAARHVTDLYSLLPPNIDEFVRLFDTAIKGQALDSELAEMVDAVMPTPEALALGDAPQNAPGSGGPMGGGLGRVGGMGGMGGMGGGGGGRGAPPGMRFAMPAMPGAAAPADPSAVARDEAGRAVRLLRAADGLSRESKSLADAKGEEAKLYAKKSGSRADANLYFDDAGLAAERRQLFRPLDPTMEWAENNYYHLPIEAHVADLVSVNAFWRDYAQHDPAQPFQSKNFAEASGNFAEMMFALALLDLPFESPKHDVKFEGRQMTMKVAGPTIVFHEEIRPIAAAAGATSILVSQNFFRHGDRTREENGEQVDKYVTEEFLTQTVYGCQVVVTNPTSTAQKLTVLIQTPAGSIPVLNSQPTKTVYLSLPPYQTQTVEYSFYFPAAGDFPHFPVHVAKNEQLVASASPFTFHVVAKASKIDTQAWDYLSQFGTDDEVLTALAKRNVHSLNLDKIAFRMKDKAFFEKTLQLLSQRRAFNATLWSYAIEHNAPAAANQFLQYVDQIVAECGGRISSPLFTLDPVEHRSYEHLEYKPLVNARAHALGKRRQIVNDRFHGQYHRLLTELSFERTLSANDLLAVTYYLLLQDRIEEALATFARVDVQQLPTKLQYDYCAAYLKFFTLDLAGARAIAAKYAEYPVDRWRNTFLAVTAQIDEAEGKGAATVDAKDRNQQQTSLAATEPSFDFQVEAKQLTINYQNIKSARVNYYVMDVELLFSRNPFVQQFSGEFSAIRPNLTQELPLPEKDRTFKAALPESLANKNVLVEVVAGGQTKTQAYYSNSLNVQIIGNYGQVRVTHATTGKPVSKAYVKVYARMGDGQVKFYKDGYTDVRGRFDYASLSTNDLETAQKFSILILSDEFGALVREADPPAR